MLNIAFFLNALDVGGTCKSAWLMAKYIKHPVTFFTYRDADLTRLDQINEKCEVRFIDRKNPDFSPLSEFDIVHVFQSGYAEKPRPNVDFKKKLGSKFVIHNVFGAYDLNPFVDMDIYMSNWMMQHSYPVPGRKRTFIDNPVDMPYSRSPSKYYDETIILGRNGRKDPGTYCDISVRAASLLIDQGLQVEFELMSPPDNMLADLDKYAVPYNIHGNGFSPISVSRFYNTLDVYCESRADGHTGGSVIIEAMAHSIPVVTHRVYSRPDFTCYNAQCELVEDKITGRVTEPDPEQFAKAIIDCFRKREMYGYNGFNKYLKDSKPEVVAEKLEKTYESLWS